MFIKQLLIIIAFGAGSLFVSAQDSNNRFHAVNRLVEQALELRENGAYDSALLYLTNAGELSHTFNLNRLHAKIKNETGITFMYLARYDEALIHIQKSMLLYKEENDSSGIAECLNNIASIQYGQKLYSSALQNYRQSLEFRLKLDLRDAAAVSYNNIGLCLSALKAVDSALYYHGLSLNHWQINRNVSGIGVTLNHIGNCYVAKGDLSLAIHTLLSAYHLYDSLNTDKLNQLFISIDIGRLYQTMNRSDTAERWCLQAYQVSKEINSIVNTRNACDCLYQVYSSKGDHKNALLFFQEYNQISDSLSGQKMAREITRLELNYAYEQSKLRDSLNFASQSAFQKERFKRQKISLISTAGLLLMILLYAVSSYRSKKKSEQLLLNILPKSTADELKKHGSTTAKRHENISVMFIDFVDFTRNSQHMNAEQLVSEINVCFTAFDHIIEKYNLDKIKTIGDAYMVAGGLHQSVAEGAILILRAGLDMLDELSIIRKNHIGPLQDFFHVRIGVHTGDVVAGVVGYKKFAYDIWGNTVNLASRMERSSEAGKINISESTYQLVNERFNCTYRGVFDVAGKDNLQMYFCDSEKKM